MATKKMSPSSEKKLKATIKSLKAKLKRADAKATRWQKKAKANQAAVASSRSRVTKLEKKLTEARLMEGPLNATRHGLPSPAEVIAPEAVVSEPTTTPDASWTVVRLREEARARGLTGMSGKPKAEVLAALT
jgi:hypothetical protein